MDTLTVKASDASRANNNTVKTPKSIPIQIREFHFSSIWTDTTLPLLNDPPAPEAPLRELGRADTYKPLFEKTLALQPYRTGVKRLPLGNLPGVARRITPLSPPWPEADGQHFWQKYLNLPTLERVSGSQAWNGLVPLRAKFPCLVQPGDWPTLPGVLPSFTLESFFYPHGVAFIFTVKCRTVKPIGLKDMVDVAFEIKKKKLTTKWQAEIGLFSVVKWKQPPVDGITLEMLAIEAMSANVIVALGPLAATHNAASPDPFTIFTVVVADVPEPGKPITEEVHRVLDRVSGWGTNPYATLPKLDTMRVDVKSSGPGRALYCRLRGRAVWFPELAVDPAQQHLLRCYHRNLTLVSMQVESLCGVSSATASRIREHSNIPDPLKACAIKAAGSLGRLYGTKKYKGSYRSMSAVEQMKQNDYVEDVSLLRKRFEIGSGRALGEEPD